MTSSLAAELIEEAERLEALAGDEQPVVSARSLLRSARLLRTAADVVNVGMANAD